MEWALQCFPTDRPKSAREFQDALLGKKTVSFSSALPIEKKGETVNVHAHEDKAAMHRKIKPIIYTLVLTIVFIVIFYFWSDIIAFIPTAKKMTLDAYRDGLEIAKNLRQIILDKL